MPKISKFNGLTVKMYYRQNEHNPPHIHFFYGEYQGVLEIKTGKLIDGKLPKTALKMAQEWTLLYTAELSQIWNSQKFYELPPLD